MRKLYISMMLAAGFMMAAAPAAYAAKDYCYNSDGLILVAKGHSLPKPNKCSKTFQGFADGTRIIMGNACMNAAGTLIRVGYTISPTVGGTDIETGNLEIPSPALTGGTATYCGDFDGGSLSCVTGGSASVVLCSPIDIPASTR